MFKKVYDFGDDRTLLTAFMGVGSGADADWFRLPFGPIGSESWWKAISTETIQARVLEGTIVRYFPAGEEHGHYAEFEITDPEGNTTNWMAHGEMGSARLYNVGDRVKIKYMLLDVLPGYPGRRELVLEIWRRTA